MWLMIRIKMKVSEMDLIIQIMLLYLHLYLKWKYKATLIHPSIWWFSHEARHIYIRCVHIFPIFSWCDYPCCLLCVYMNILLRPYLDHGANEKFISKKRQSSNIMRDGRWFISLIGTGFSDHFSTTLCIFYN